MIERPAAAPASVEQLMQPDSSDISALIGLMRQEQPTRRLRPSSEFEARIAEYLDHEETALFAARTAINHLMGEDAAEIIGYMATRERPQEDPGTLHVEGMFVRPDLAGHPWGTGLVNRVVEHAKKRGLVKVQIDRTPQHSTGHALLINAHFKRGQKQRFERTLDI